MIVEARRKTSFHSYLIIKKTMKKLLTISAIALVPVVAASSANAFWGGNFNQERFTEMKTLFSQNSDFESFQTAIKAKREERRAAFENMTDEEKEAFRAENKGRHGRKGSHGERDGLGKEVERTIENISNGIVMTMTSEDAEVVEKLQNREDKKPNRDEVTRTVVKISNGIKVTITSDDEEIVEKIQNREKREGKHSGRGRGQGRGMQKQE